MATCSWPRPCPGLAIRGWPSIPPAAPTCSGCPRPSCGPSGTGSAAEGEHPAAAVEGRNDFGEESYGGSLPPVGDGPHRYVFRVYAAAAPLGLTGVPSAQDLRRALAGKELASGTLVGTYQR
jgi:hypothetical protein